MRGLVALGRLDDHDLRLVLVLDGNRGDALDSAERLDGAVLDAVDLDLDDDAVRDLSLPGPRGVPSATIFPFATTAIRSQRLSASNM